MTSLRERIGDRLRRGLRSGRRVIQRLPSHLHLPRYSFNGAEDIIYVRRGDSIRCTGMYLSISRLSSIRYGERDYYIKIKINGQVVMDFSINLNEISRGAGKNEVGVPIYAPTDWENELIFSCLRPGRNKITFYIEGQPNSSVDARIYRWEWGSKVVVVDMDGTITRSELRGILRCYTEEHYLHPEVSRFFLYLKALGYKVICLTARPITTIKSTRKYLVGDFDQFQKEESKEESKLPDGPLFTSCDGRIRTTLNYVGNATGLGGTSHSDFKCSFLKEITKVLINGPLFAGFGNTVDDYWSYSSVDIPCERIFHVEKGGRIFSFRRHEYRSYGDLLLKCRSEGIFPYVEFDGDFFGHFDQNKRVLLNWITDRMPPLP